MSGDPTIDAIRGILADIPDPESGRPLADMGQVGTITADAGRLAVEVGLTTHSGIIWKQIRGRLSRSPRCEHHHHAP